jgi:hypothetical protein
VYFITFSGAQCNFNVGAETTLLAWWECLVTSQTLRRRRGASTLFIIVAWHLWKERNARLFDNRSAPIVVILDMIKMEIDLWIAGGAKELGSLLCE